MLKLSRFLLLSAPVAICLALAGCSTGPDAKSVWLAAGNNGGKADRFTVARAAAADQADVGIAQSN